MVKPRHSDDEGSPFAFDEDEDMDALMLQAEQSGSAAVGEIETDYGFDQPKAVEPENERQPTFEDIMSGAPIRTPEAPPAAPASAYSSPVVPSQVSPATPVAAPVASTPVAPVQEPAPRPVPVYEPKPEPARQQPAPAQSPARAISRGSQEDQIALASRVLRTVDVYRSLNENSRDIVAQLLAPTPEQFTTDEGAIAIFAINAEPLQESTQRALIEAKEATPVDRVFYVLALQDDVLRYLGELVQAYSRVELPSMADRLGYARSLVGAIDQLGDEPVIYADAMARVLEAAQGA